MTAAARKLSEDLRDAIDGGDECRGRDSQLTEWIERAESLEAQIDALMSAQAIGQAAVMFKAFMGKQGVTRADVEEWLARFDATLGADEPQQSVIDSIDSPQEPLNDSTLGENR